MTRVMLLKVAGTFLLATLVGCSSVTTRVVILDVPEIVEGVENALARIEMLDSRGDNKLVFETAQERTVFAVQPNIPMALGIRIADRLSRSPRAFLERLNRTEIHISVTVQMSKGITDESGATSVIVAADAAPKGGSVSRRHLYYGSGAFKEALPAAALNEDQVRIALESALDELASEIFRGFVRDASPDLIPDSDAPGRQLPIGPELTS